MKILVDGRVLRDEFFTGVQCYTQQLLKSFDRLGVPYDIASPKSNNRCLQHIWEHLSLPDKARFYDLLFCPGNISPTWKPKNLKIVVSIHDLSFMYFKNVYKSLFRFYYNFTIPKIIKVADKIITVSNTERETIMESFPRYAKKIVSIHNGIDEIFLSSETILEKENYLLYVGSLNPRKNLQGVIEAFLQIAEGIPHKLVIVGVNTGAFKKTRTKDSDRIKFLGFVNQEYLVQLYRNAAVFVFPSLYEGFGLPLLEAMACGCPVITSNISSLPEVAGDSAIMIDPYDVNAMANAMYNVLTNESLRQEMIKKGLQRIKLFSWEKAAKETLKVFEEVCG